MSTIKERVLRVFKNKWPDLEIAEEADMFHDLGLDSLDLMELVMDLEDEFNVNIPDKMYEGVKTPGDIVRVIEKHCDLANDTFD